MMADAADLKRGTLRLLAHMGYQGIEEFPLKNNRRADLIALGPKGEVVIVEVKSGLADFQADAKWPEYKDFCESLYFAVDADFPSDVLPPDEGLIVADAYGADILRKPQARPMNAARRKSLTLEIARTAAKRLHNISDPDAGS